LTNSNHRVVKAKTLIPLPSQRTRSSTHLTSQGTKTARPRRSPNLSL